MTMPQYDSKFKPHCPMKDCNYNIDEKCNNKDVYEKCYYASEREVISELVTEMQNQCKLKNKIRFSRYVFIVFKYGGTCPISYGASEEWFPTYKEAKEYADKFIQKCNEKYRRGVVDYNSVIIYEAPKSVLHTSHSIPCGRVWFKWRNY